MRCVRGTHFTRPHREAFEPYVAIEMLIKETAKANFDPLAIRSLLRTVGLFPIGSYVRLSDGSVGQVIRNHETTMTVGGPPVF